MKTIRALFAILLIFTAYTLSSQTPLSESQQESTVRYIYKLTYKELKGIYIKGKEIEESMLHSPIASYKKGENIPELSRGNYIIVKADKNKLNFISHTVDNINVKILPADAAAMIYLYDTLGNVITDAIVKKGSKILKYNHNTRTYNTSEKIKDEQLIEVNNNGVYHYLEVGNDDYPYRYKNSFSFRRLWWRTKYKFKNLLNFDKKYNGFIVFSKPKYKPNEVVKLKGYIADQKGKPYNKKVELVLRNYYSYPKIDTILATLSPYRPGMYEHSFKLDNRLKIRLDNSYITILRTRKNGRNSDVSEVFKYEDYELKNSIFSLSTNKEKYVKGDSIVLKLKATDENNLPVYDGKVDILITSNKVQFLPSKQPIFIPNILWKQRIDMEGFSEKDVVIPDSILPNASISLNISCVFLTSNNESSSQKKVVDYNANDCLIDLSITDGLMTIRKLHNGKPQHTSAYLEINGENNEILFQDSITFPHTLPIYWNATEYRIETENISDVFWTEDIKEELITPTFYRLNDSIKLHIHNPAGIPFWYLIKRKDNIVENGYATNLSFSKLDKGKEGYSLRINYILGEEVRTINKLLPFVEKNINMDVNTTTIVQPGQTAIVDIQISDKKGNPVKDADITAYAFTSKFKDGMPNILIHGKTKYAKKISTVKYDAKEEKLNVKQKLWNDWMTMLSLDTIEYYKFIYPKPYYIYQEPTLDGTTQISPFVALDGNLEGVHLLWIDNKLYYVNQAEQAKSYSFTITPGIHNLKIRTYDRDIEILNVDVQEGMKNIMSVDGSKSSSFQLKYNHLIEIVVFEKSEKHKGKLTDNEHFILKNEMLTIDNYFGTFLAPNLQLDLPAYINSGGTFYYINSKKSPRSLNYHINPNHRTLIGPFPQMKKIPHMAPLFTDNNFTAQIPIEGGYNYTVFSNYIKMKSWDKSPINLKLEDFTQDISFKEYPITKEEIFNSFNHQVENSLKSNSGLITTLDSTYKQSECKLSLQISTYSKGNNGQIMNPILILFTHQNDSSTHLFYGGTRAFYNLPSGDITMTLVFNDSSSYSQNLNLYNHGQNYLWLDDITPSSIDSLGKFAINLFNKNTSKHFAQNPFSNLTNYDSSTNMILAHELGSYNKRNALGNVVTGTIRDTEGEPIIGASIVIEGTSVGNFSDIDGRFQIDNIGTGQKLLFSFVGFNPLLVELKDGYDYDIVMEESRHDMNEVVVIGYGTAKKSHLAGSIRQSFLEQDYDIPFAISEKIAGVKVEDSKNVVIIVDGKVYNGSIDDINPNSIASINVLNKESSVALYGAKATNGAIIIETKNARLNVDYNTDNTPFGGGRSLNVRKNFHDDAFWQPRIKTDEKGRASFKVTYPDDITQWNARFIAIGGRNQSDAKQLNIKSVKSISAQVSTPRFIIKGDSLNFIGKITNYTIDSLNINQIAMVDSVIIKKDSITIGHTYNERIPLRTSKTSDSIKITYAIQTTNGYSDGEEQTIPAMEKGMLITQGEFRIINNSQPHEFSINLSDSNKAYIYAETSGLEVLKTEIERVNGYPYLCNEQMASKIKVLLAKKYATKALNVNFSENTKINQLVSRLEKNTNEEGLWGWWNQDKTELWISDQVIEALIAAENSGYKIRLDKERIASRFIKDMDDVFRNTRLTTRGNAALKQELLRKLNLLYQLNPKKMDLTPYFNTISQLKDESTYGNLLSMMIMSKIGMSKDIGASTLLNLSQKTIMGSLFWADDRMVSIQPRFGIHPYISHTETTLMAYKLLKNIGGYEKELELIRNYFFEIRKTGFWLNTFEASRIIETIIPDMLEKGESFSNIKININGEKITTLPYSGETQDNHITVQKTGTTPLFFSIYQSNWDPNPKAKSEGFSIETIFHDSNDSTALLVAGKPEEMKVIVTVEGDAEYVMIEVPIPAGCTYEQKEMEYRWKEAHREYFKDKVSIFCNRLKKGKHIFTIKLLPRYSGEYTLNPAKVELMYFPTFYGNEIIKEVLIKSE